MSVLMAIVIFQTHGTFGGVPNMFDFRKMIMNTMVHMGSWRVPMFSQCFFPLHLQCICQPALEVQQQLGFRGGEALPQLSALNLEAIHQGIGEAPET